MHAARLAEKNPRVQHDEESGSGEGEARSRRSVPQRGQNGDDLFEFSARIEVVAPASGTRAPGERYGLSLWR